MYKLQIKSISTKAIVTKFFSFKKMNESKERRGGREGKKESEEIRERGTKRIIDNKIISNPIKF